MAAFDTRITSWVAKIFGYAATRIANDVKRKGGTVVVPPEGFSVEGTKGPLNDGEVERAGTWAKALASRMTG